MDPRPTAVLRSVRLGRVHTFSPPMPIGHAPPSSLIHSVASTNLPHLPLLQRESRSNTTYSPMRGMRGHGSWHVDGISSIDAPLSRSMALSAGGRIFVLSLGRATDAAPHPHIWPTCYSIPLRCITAPPRIKVDEWHAVQACRVVAAPGVAILLGMATDARPAD